MTVHDDLADLEALCNAYMAPSTAERARSVAQRGPLPYYDGEAQNETERIWRALERLAPWRYENYGAWIETGMALKEYGAEGRSTP